MSRSLLVLLPLLAALTGCTTYDDPTVDADAVSSDAMVVSSDIDHNNVDDFVQTFVIGNDAEDGNVVVAVKPDQKSPYGDAVGQKPWFWGFGSGMYTESDGYVPFFPAVEVTDDAGNFVGYGNKGWRCGTDYELGMGDESAVIGSQAGWWNVALGVDPQSDVTAYIVDHIDAAGVVDADGNSCERHTSHIAMRVWQDCTVEPLGYSIEPADDNCYAN